jgi:hypothetical protein
MGAVNLRLVPSLGLAHEGAHQALRCDDESVMRIERIERQPVAVGQSDDVGAGGLQDLLDAREFSGCFGKVRP